MSTEKNPRLVPVDIWDVWTSFERVMADKGIKSVYVGSQMSDALPHLEAFLVALDVVAYYPCYAEIDEYELCMRVKGHDGDHSTEFRETGGAL